MSVAGEVGPCSAWPEQIDRDHHDVGGLVGDDENLGRPGEKIDADAAVELALGLRDVGVARADQHVHGLDALGAQRHRGHGLHAAQHVDFVGAPEVHRGDGGGVRLSLVRRRAGDDARHARDLRGHDAHVRRCDHGIAAARDVAADALDGYVLVAEDDARQRLDLDVAQRVALGLREVAHLGLGEPDIRDRVLGDLRDDGGDVVVAQPEGGRGPLVEFLRKLAHGRVAARRHVGEYAFDGLLDLAIGRLGRRRRYSLLEILGQGDLHAVCGLLAWCIL